MTIVAGFFILLSFFLSYFLWDSALCHEKDKRFYKLVIEDHVKAYKRLEEKLNAAQRALDAE